MRYDALIQSFEDHIAKLEGCKSLPVMVHPERYPKCVEALARAEMQREEVERLRELQAEILKRAVA